MNFLEKNKQEWPRQTKPKKGTKVRDVNRACFPKEKHQNSQKNGRNAWTFRFGPFFGLVCRGDSWKSSGQRTLPYRNEKRADSLQAVNSPMAVVKRYATVRSWLFGTLWIAAIFAICNCDAHRGPQKSQRFPREERAMLHCDLRVRWKVASDSRFRAAISELANPFFLRDFWRFGSVNAEIASDCDCEILVR